MKYFLVDRHPQCYKCPFDEISERLRPGDEMFVQRNQVRHKTTYTDGTWPNIRDTDLLLVYVDGAAHKITGANFKELF